MNHEGVSRSRGAPRRVGLVIGQLTHGGAERQLYELARRLPARGWEPHVFCLSKEDSPYGDLLRAAGVPVVCLERRRNLEIRRVRRLAAAFREHHIDLAHSFLFIANAYAWLACCLARVPAFLPSVRNLEPHRSRAARLIDTIVLRSSRVTLVNAAFLAEWVTRTYGVQAGRLRVVPNGVDESRFAGIAALPESRGGGATVGSLSLFKKQKRIPILLDIARRVRQARPGTRFRFVGDGPEHADMLRLRDNMGLGEVVEMPGRSEDVTSELARFDLFVLASDREGTPNAILEAMAAARPVVASAVEGTAEVVEEGRTGLLFPPDDPARAAEAAVALLDDPARASAMGRAGRDSVRTRYSLDLMVDLTEAVYRELLL